MISINMGSAGVLPNGTMPFPVLLAVSEVVGVSEVLARFETRRGVEISDLSAEVLRLLLFFMIVMYVRYYKAQRWKKYILVEVKKFGSLMTSPIRNYIAVDLYKLIH